VLTRDAAVLLRDQLTAMLADPAEGRLHRAMRWTYLAMMHRPLAKAMFTANYELLGELMTASSRRWLTELTESVGGELS
jgi:hypothetical protein